MKKKKNRVAFAYSVNFHTLYKKQNKLRTMNDPKIDKTFQDPSANKAAKNIAPEETKQFEESAEYEHVLQQAERILQQTTIEFGPDDRERVEKAQTETWAKIESGISRRGKTVSLYRQIMRVAASVAAVLMVGVASLFLFKGPAEMIVVENTGTEVRELLLLDSTRVWLQLGAKITYPKKFSRKHRPVQLSGEAFFDVARDPSRPFTVSTTAAKIEVLGTRFDVNAAADGTLTEVALESGSVALHMPGKENESVKIKPGELAVADISDASISVTETDPYMYSVWKETELAFRAQPLGYIVKLLEKAYGVDIRLNNEVLGRTVYTGRFKKSLPLEEVLAIIEMNTSMEYRFNADGSIDIK